MTVRERLETDYPFYARNCLKIVGMDGRTIPLSLKPAQLRIEEALQAQEAAGLPGRVIVPKSRREGVSTYAEGRIVWRTTTRANWRAKVIAHNDKITGILHQMSTNMVAHLPHETIDGLELKPPIASARRKSEITFGTEQGRARLAGDLGLNSSLTTATAGEPEATRGDMNFDLHLSEAGFYPDAQETMLALLSTVPDEPGTTIIIESTPNGRNDFWRRCKRAEAGEGDYALVFLPWYLEPRYVRPFASEVERDEFIATIGVGDYGEDEPELCERMEADGIDWEEIPERLKWRRWAIVDLAGGELRDFKQEYPSYLDEGFLATSGQVFNSVFIAHAREDANGWPSLHGRLSPAATEKVRKRGRELEIPTDAWWTPKHELAGAVHTAFWEVWHTPQREDPETDKPWGQYIVTIDPASGEELAQVGSAYSAVEVIDHRNLVQMAEYRSREDAYQVGVQALLAAYYYGSTSLRGDGKIRLPWIAVEITGGYGDSIASWLWRDVGYPKVYFRRNEQGKKESQGNRLGWQTTPVTKGMLENRIHELLRTRSTGIRSAGLCDELDTFIRDDKGRTGPEEGSFADRLMSWGIGQQIAHEKPLRSERRGPVSVSTHSAVA